MSSTGRTCRSPSEDSAATRERVLDSALSVLARTGFDGLNLQAVADEAGSGKATVYAYFDSREQLVAEIVWRTLSLAPDDLPASTAADIPASGPAGPLTLSRIVDAITELTDNPELTELRDRLAEQVRMRVHAALGPDADPAVAAQLQGQYIKALATAGAAYAAGIPGAPIKESRGLYAQRR